MEKFVIENKLYLFESIKENRMTSYNDNLINNDNDEINTDKNINRYDRVPLNIQKFAQRKELLNKRDMVISKFNLTQYEDITYDTIKNGKVKTIEPEFVCSFNTVDEKGNKITYTKKMLNLEKPI